MRQASLKCVYEPARPGDELRVLIDASWPRGVSLRRAALDLWARDLAPSPALRWRLIHDPENRAEFERLYQRELEAHAGRLRALLTTTGGGSLTLLYAGRSMRAWQPCAGPPPHAIVLVDALQRLALCTRSPGRCNLRGHRS